MAKRKQFHRFTSRYPNMNRKLASRNPKPHLVFHEGKWKLFANWWKCAWSMLNPDNSAGYVSGNTIQDVRFHLSREHRRRFVAGIL